MGEKPSDPEAPVETSNHLESSVSIEKENAADLARQWSRDVKKDHSAPVTQNKKLKNPLAGLTQEELFRDVEEFAREKSLEHIVEDLKKGALVAQDPKIFEQLDGLEESDKELLRREKTHRWHQPWMMYFMTSKSRPSQPRGPFELANVMKFSVPVPLSCRAWIRPLSTVHRSFILTSSTSPIDGNKAC